MALLSSVSGMGFGIMSGSFSLVNVLADAAGPGTVGLRGDSNLFFLTSAVTTLCFVLLHTAWGVLFFHALDKKQYLALMWVVASHLFVSCLVNNIYFIKSQPFWITPDVILPSHYLFIQTLLNASQLYLATILPAYTILIITAAWALRAAGASCDSFRQSFKISAPLTVPVSAEEWSF